MASQSFARKHKEKRVFLWCFARLFVTLRSKGREAAHVLTPEGMSVALRAAIETCFMALA